MDRKAVCEICGAEVHWKDFQRHLVENHGMLFVQYVGLVSRSFQMLEWLSGVNRSAKTASREIVNEDNI